MGSKYVFFLNIPEASHNPLKLKIMLLAFTISYNYKRT